MNRWPPSAVEKFLERHNVAKPTPATRQSYLNAAKENYNSIVTKLGETAAYPGNWLYESWSDADLK